MSNLQTTFPTHRRYEPLKLPDMRTVMWPDGTRITLHAWAPNAGVPCPFRRMLMLPEGNLLVDLRDVLFELAEDHRTMHPIDWAGNVYWSLRLGFRNVEAFAQAARAVGTWLPMPAAVARSAAVIAKAERITT